MSNSRNIDNFGDKLRPTPFTSENQPENPGRKKTSHIRKIMQSMGKSMAPADLLNDEKIKAFITEHGFKGTVNEVLIARLYTMALYNSNEKAMKLILDTLNNKFGGRKTGGVVIQFISPQPQEQEQPIDLENDSWSLQSPPGESKADA